MIGSAGVILANNQVQLTNAQPQLAYGYPGPVSHILLLLTLLTLFYVYLTLKEH